MAMATDEPRQQRRNFAAWSAVAAPFYLLVIMAASLIVEGMIAMPRSSDVAAILGLSLLFSTAVVGFSSRKRPVSLRAFRNFVIQNLMALSVFLLVIWCFSQADSGALSTSKQAAAALGAALVAIALLGTLGLASTRTGVDLVEDEDAAEDMRERFRLFLYSLIWLAAYGLLLIGLSLAGPGGVLPSDAALAGALVLIFILAILGIATWRLSDELMRTLSYETGNMAFYLLWAVGGGWAILAHLGLVIEPTPLDWLTMSAFFLFAASFIAVGRRKLLRG